MDTILLYSGGLDSQVSAGLLMEQNPARRLTIVFFDFGQHTAVVEWRATEQCVQFLQEKYPGQIDLQYRRLNDYRAYVEDVSIVSGENVPKADEDPHLFFVPGRNIIFLLYAAIMAYGPGCRDIVFSPHQWWGCGDSSPAFIEAFSEALRQGFGEKARGPETYQIRSVIAHLGKDGVIREGLRLGLPLALSWSCHDAKEKQCGVCHNCAERKKAFALVGVPDPTEYLE